MQPTTPGGSIRHDLSGQMPCGNKDQSLVDDDVTDDVTDDVADAVADDERRQVRLLGRCGIGQGGGVAVGRHAYVRRYRALPSDGRGGICLPKGFGRVGWC